MTRTRASLKMDQTADQQSLRSPSLNEHFHLASVLTDRLPSLRKRHKRQRTKAQILAATAREIERVGYEGLTIDGITESIGIARSTFYLHFRDRAHAATTVMRVYIAFRNRQRPRGGRALPVRESIERYNTYWVGVFARNVKLLRGREVLMNQGSDLVDMVNRINAAWTEMVVVDVQHRYPRIRTQGELDLLKLRIRGAIAMTDGLLREIYLMRVPSLEPFFDQERTVVAAISEMWFRIVYAEHQVDRPTVDTRDHVPPFIKSDAH